MAFENLEYARDMARELARLADDEGDAFLGYLFRIAERAADELITAKGSDAHQVEASAEP